MNRDCTLGGLAVSRLAALDPATLAQHMHALADNKLARDRALADEAVRHWEAIWNERWVQSVG